MRKIRSISFVLVFSLLICLFSGCMGMNIEIQVNEDGSGKMIGFLGITKDMIDYINSSDDSADVYDYSELSKGVYNGIEYWGEYDEVTFEDLDEFKDLIYDFNSGDNLLGLNTGYFDLSKDENGYFTLKFEAFEDTGDVSYIMENADDIDLPVEEYDKILNSFYANMSYTFPSQVYQVMGDSAGITIQDNTVSFDILQMKVPSEGEDALQYIFTTNPNFNAEELVVQKPIKNDSKKHINVKVDDVLIKWSDAEPFIDKNNRTMVPLRPVAEALNLDVSWDAENRQAVFSKNDRYLVFTIDDKVAYGYSYTELPMNDMKNSIQNDSKFYHPEIAIEMDTEAVIVNDRTYAPIRYLAEYFSCTVDWDGSTSTVLIYHKLR